MCEKTAAAPFKNLFFKGCSLQPAQVVLLDKHSIMTVVKSLILKTLQRTSHLNAQAKRVKVNYDQMNAHTHLHTQARDNRTNIRQMLVGNSERIREYFYEPRLFIIINEKEINCSQNISL